MQKSQDEFKAIFHNLVQDTRLLYDFVRSVQNEYLGSLDTSIASTPYKHVYTEDRVRLKHYRPVAPATEQLGTPLLIVYALINRETMLDLEPRRSVVRGFLSEGIELYMIDWGYPGRKDRYLTMDDHINGYLNNIVDFICLRHNLEKINLMGVCMGGTFAAIYSSIYPHKIKNLITTVAPTYFDTKQGLLHVWAKSIDIDQLVDTYGNMPGDLLNICFLLLNPARLIIDKYVGFIHNIDSKKFAENFIRMEKWIFDSPDVPGETIRQFMKDCYQQNLLMRGEMRLADQPIDLRKIDMPLLNIYGRKDHLVPPGACAPLAQIVSSQDVENVCIDTGHIGIYVSSKCQNEFVPKIAGWLREREPTATRTAGGLNFRP